MFRWLFEWFFPISAENKQLSEDINKLEGKIEVLPNGRVSIIPLKKPK